MFRPVKPYFASLIPAILCLLNAVAAEAVVLEDYDPTTLVFPSFLHTLGIRKATKTHLMIYTRNKIKVRDPQGMVVVRLDSWEDPNDKKDDDEVTGYGVNAGENVIIYNKSMTALGFYGRGKKGNRDFNRPTAITANQRGDVYVADTGNHRIVRLFNPGRKLSFVKGIGGQGTLAGQFQAPQGIAIDANDHVYVSDTGNHRIQVLLPNDQLHIWFGEQGFEDGQLWHPGGIAVTNGRERWSHYKDAFIAVIDLDKNRLQKFSLDGKFIAAARLNPHGYKQVELMYLAIDYYSNIWVTDRSNHCIHKFDRDLNYLCSFGRKGRGDKEFDEPRGISIYKRFGQVFIGEKEAAHYYWIGTDVFEFQALYDKKKNTITVPFFLTEPSFLSLVIETPDGQTINVFKRMKYFSGQRKIVINSNMQNVLSIIKEDRSAHNSVHSVFAGGKYRIKLKAEATYSSLNYFVKEVETSVMID